MVLKQLSRSDINYLDYTWNPVKARDGGYICTKVSEGCLNCWAGKMRHRRLFHNPVKEDYRYTGERLDFMLDEEVLTAPLRRREPSIIGVQFMSDLFHKDVPDEFLHRVLAVMSLCPRHTFIVLTKRADRMREYFTQDGGFGPWGAVEHFARKLVDVPPGKTLANYGWSNMPHVWLGVSVENQEVADKRIPVLLSVPAAKRWVSVEPMLGPIELVSPVGTDRRYLGRFICHECEDDPGGYVCECCVTNTEVSQIEGGLDWVVCGCESGPGRRPMDLDWVRSLRDQCVAAGVPFWFKQAYEGRKLVQLPMLDGRQWKEKP